MLKQITKNDLKEEYRVFFMVTGHLNTTPQTVLDAYDEFFTRLWIDGSNGAPLSDYEEQFEIAWKAEHNDIT
tara:strand:+ start:1434 stop:1649 length:216 start_codon:yes stop_codon:yes gene_type:complete